MNRCWLRWLASWMAWAMTSLPVPVSPWMSTEQSTGATSSTFSRTARNFGLDPITPGGMGLTPVSTTLGAGIIVWAPAFREVERRPDAPAMDSSGSESCGLRACRLDFSCAGPFPRALLFHSSGLRKKAHGCHWAPRVDNSAMTSISSLDASSAGDSINRIKRVLHYSLHGIAVAFGKSTGRSLERRSTWMQGSLKQMGKHTLD